MTGRRIRLTDAGVGRLKPGKTEYVVWDNRVAGLGVRVRPSDHRSFVWHGHANGAAVRKTIGSAALKTVEDARRECLAIQNGAEISARKDGKEESVVPSFRDFAMGEWKAASQGRWGAWRRKSVHHMLEKQLLPAFGPRRLDRICRQDVERWFDAYSQTAPGGANHALQVLQQIMKAAVASGLITGNPAQDVRTNPRTKLTRFLSAGEIVRLHRVLDRLVDERPSRQAQADIIRLLLLIGCRRGEILKLKWSEVDGDVLRLAEAKTGPRTVWLSEAAQTIVARQTRDGNVYVFPSPKNPAKPCSNNLELWYRARREAGIEDVRLHDLRHTVASQAVARGIALSTVARMLGHSDPRMTLRYAHVSDRDVEAAAERIGKVIEAAMTGGQLPGPTDLSVQASQAQTRSSHILCSAKRPVDGPGR